MLVIVAVPLPMKMPPPSCVELLPETVQLDIVKVPSLKMPAPANDAVLLVTVELFSVPPSLT